MAATEKRLPREVFTKKLRRICERLDEASRRAVSYKHFFLPRTIEDQVAVSEVWVVGSYARGAPLCGDLDVILKVSGLKGEPPVSAVTRVFFGSLPYVRYYLGDPTKNQSGVEFPDALQIWSGPGCNWQALIDAIVVNPLAGRAPRPVDTIPLRLEQLRSDIDELSALVESRDAGLIEWEFVSLPDGVPEMPQAEQDRRDELALVRFTNRWGRKSKALLPKLVLLMRELEPHGEWVSASFDGEHADVRCGGTRVFVGLPRIEAHLLDSNASVRQLALIPHTSTRGPNGAWLIRRGPKHPDMLSLATARMFYHLDEGRPLTIGTEPHRSFAAQILEVFESHADAEEFSVWASEGESIKMEVAHAQGPEILSVIGLCDVVMFNGEELAINHRGRRYTEGCILSIADLTSRLLPPNSTPM